MHKKKIILSIAGFDPSGGAGLQADIKTFCDFGLHPLTVATSLTIQDSKKVYNRYDIDSIFFKKQLLKLLDDIEIDAIKIGMIPNKRITNIIYKALKNYKKYIVLDPIIFSTSGYRLMEKDAIEVLKKRILPFVDIITPNIPEAQIISNMKIKTQKDIKKAAKKIRKMGVKFVLIKGGHLKSDSAIDILYDGKNFYAYKGKMIKQETNIRGTGCTLSSAIASLLAKGIKPKKAVKKAKQYITKAIKKSYLISEDGARYLGCRM